MVCDLGDDGDPGAEVLQSEGGNIAAVNDDGARGWLNDTEESKSEGRLACTCPSHYTNLGQ